MITNTDNYFGARMRSLSLLALLSLSLTLGGCFDSPGSDEGNVTGSVEDLDIGDDGRPTNDPLVVTGNIVLPTDTLLNLFCPDVGISGDICVLEDPENPYRDTATNEFNVNDPDAPTKFVLANEIPDGPTGAKARFYLWATALARFPSGENQWYTAQALHELWDAAEDPIVQDQAIRAYVSVLDNHFGSVTFFPSSDFGLLPNVDFSVVLNELVAEQLSCSPRFKHLIPLAETDPFYGRGFLASEGYTYDYVGQCENGLVTVSQFP